MGRKYNKSDVGNCNMMNMTPLQKDNENARVLRKLIYVWDMVYNSYGFNRKQKTVKK